MQRYFINKENVFGNQIIINDSDYHHITKVMRMRLGDKVIVCDNNDSFLCSISDITDKQVELMIEEKLIENKEIPVSVTIAQGVVRREKMEEVVDKITQLGAVAYLPVMMERCNVKFNDEKLERKLERMNKIAKEASEQSHRTYKLKVEAPIDFKSFIKESSKYDLCLVAYENISEDQSLKTVLKEKKYKNILVLVGPEGGISEKELKALLDNKFIPVALGPRILRTEVAPSYIMAAISYELEV